MGDVGALEWVLRRDRAVTLTALAGVAALSWAYIVAGAGMEMPSMQMAGMVPMPWTPGYFALMAVMWTVMMVAMMLPSAAPMILLFALIQRRSRRAPPHAGTLRFTLGYVVVWAGFSLVATTLQWGLERLALLSPMMTATGGLFGGVVLVAAGIYQFTPQKHACLRRCRSPMEFLSEHWQQGPFGIGLRHGLFCVGCCWALMALLFVGGVMNLLWVALIALYVLVEKLAPRGDRIGYVTGVVLLAWGGWMLSTTVV